MWRILPSHRKNSGWTAQKAIWNLSNLLRRIGYDTFSCLKTPEGHAGNVPREPAGGTVLRKKQYS